MISKSIDNLIKSFSWAVGVATLLAGSILYFGNVPVLTICLVIGIGLVGGWLIIRGVVQKARLPRSNFEIPLLAFLLGALLSVLLSPDPRMGLERIAWFIFLSVLFYIILDQAEQGSFRSNIRAILLLITGPFILLALLETYALYLGWWGKVGSQSIMPPFPFRYNSLIVQSNIFMGLINLCAPLALVLFLTTQRRGVRILTAFWLVTYAAALPFSSSRGGWFGAASWAGVMALLWIADKGRWKAVLQWISKHWIISSAAGAAMLMAAIFAFLKFYRIFAGNNPTHGSGFSLNRQGIWGPAISIWQASPWTGSGLGRLGLEYLRVIGFPANWWPSHAHSVPIQILAETGLVGFLPFLALTIWVAVLLIRSYQNTPASERIWSAASIAALSGFFIHGIFEEFTSLPFLVLVPLIHIAIILGAADPITRFKRISFTTLAAPALLTAVVAGYSLWGYAPLYSTSKQAVNNWQQAAETAEVSVQRDPNMSIYQSQAGIAWAMAWQQTGNPQALERARSHFAKSLKIESTNSVYWADYAIINWYAGNADAAIQAIQRAITLCPNEPSYPLNYGWFLEQLSRDDEAKAQYEKGLALDPGMALHPFWQENALRKSAVTGTQAITSSSIPHWQQSLKDTSAGNYAAAQYELAVSSMYQEPALATSTGWALLAIQKEKSTGKDISPLRATENAVEYNYWGMLDGQDAYNLYFFRQGFPMSVVPGYLRITDDYGQITVLSILYNFEAYQDCPASAKTWEVLQRELHAGELLKEGYPPAPGCVAQKK